MLDYGVFYHQTEGNSDFIPVYQEENWDEIELDILEQNVRRSLLELEEKMERFLSFLEPEEEELEFEDDQEESDVQNAQINY
jgi:hypothetical protein